MIKIHEETWMNIADASRLSGISRKKISNLIKKGDIRRQKLKWGGGSSREFIFWKDLERHLSSRSKK
jgi:hypothetical protein